MNEHGFKETIRRELYRYADRDGYVWKIFDDYEGGVPDFLLESRDRQIYVEAKFLKPPARDDTVIKLIGARGHQLSALQVEWLNRRKAKFNDAWLAVGFGDQRVQGVYVTQDWQTPLCWGAMRAYSYPVNQFMKVMFEGLPHERK